MVRSGEPLIERRDALPKIDDLPDPGHNIEETQSRDPTAHPATGDECRQPRGVQLLGHQVEKEVLLPELGIPREEQQQYPYLQGDQYVDNDRNFC